VPVNGCYQVLTTVDSEAGAKRIAAALVEEGLAACVQVLGPIASVYRWRGAIERAVEWQCIAKTSEAALPELMSRMRALHSYRQPEIVATVIDTGDPAYLDWVRREATFPREASS
jgi:periplasmic divalent cation tolerance protein